MKKILKDRVYSWNDVPAALKTQFYKTIGIGCLVVLIAIFMACVLRPPFQMVLISLGLSLIIFFSAYKFYYDLTRKGYKEIRGTVSFVKEVFSLSAKGMKRGGKKILYYHIETDDGKVIFFPADKGTDELPLDSRIKLFTATNYTSTEFNGLTRISPVWGYSLISRNSN